MFELDETVRRWGRMSAKKGVKVSDDVEVFQILTYKDTHRLAASGKAHESPKWPWNLIHEKKKTRAPARRRRPNKGGTGVSHGGRPLSLQMVPNMRAQKKTPGLSWTNLLWTRKIFSYPMTSPGAHLGRLLFHPVESGEIIKQETATSVRCLPTTSTFVGGKNLEKI